jgi:glutaredoxin
MANVKVYSTPTCPYCIRAKEYLKQSNISFENIDVSSDQEKAQEMIDALRSYSVGMVEAAQQ